ncbi:pectinesterase-like [Phoenix dactylifera]|uniref:Pectinesterase n=1 Tax=Phoenix dactylifera TaxID=42345 RepID=A0A8B7CJC8_PHODC|nr:pectinesterase-like [Phoenix dactylifera]
MTSHQNSDSTTSQFDNSKKRRKLLLLLVTSFLLIAAVIATASTLLARHAVTSHEATVSHAILRSSCLSARYPDLCYSAVAANPALVQTISKPKDVIHASINLTITAIQRSFRHVERLSASHANLTTRERTALHDCLEMFDESLDELRLTDADLRAYPAGKPLRRHALDLEILVSASMTNQESCSDGFSYEDVERRLRREILSGLTHVTHMCRNALAMIKNMIDADIAAADVAADGRGRRMLGFDIDEEGFPDWMEKKDRRRLLQATGEVKANAVVAPDGSGDYKTVGEAVAAAPAKSKTRWVIQITAGTYEENVEVPKKKTNLMFIGEGRKTTIITGSRNVVDGSTTFRSATLAVVGEGFLARGLRIQNTAGPSKHQAVALRVGSDLSAFYDCDIIGYQDTLYLHSLRHFFRSCLIQGTVDFIFGNAATVLQDCDIQVRRPNANQKNMVTADGRDDPNEPTGIAIHRSRITAAPDLEPVKSSFRSYLGRPWKEYSRAVIMESEISDVIDPAGWHEWNVPFGLDTLYYGEYKNTGAGAGTADRVKWKGYRVLTDVQEAKQFAPGNLLGGSNWLDSTGFPYSLGLSS